MLAGSVNGPAGQAVPLAGRGRECARLETLLAGARHGRSGALVLVGDPGIGKTALCEWASRRCERMTARSLRAVESELDLPFAGVSELCAEAGTNLDRLPVPQARALEGVLLRRDEVAGDRFAIGAAVLGLLGAIAGDGSALVIVDDAQWLDPASADALTFAARRLHGEGVALLLATRPGSAFAQDRSGLERLELEGIDAAASRTVLDATHGPLPERVAGLLVTRSGGNPLALREMPRLLTRTQLAGTEPIAEPLPLGETLERALLSRVAALPANTREALLIGAASGGERVQPVLDAMAAEGSSPDALAAAERAGAIAIAGERFSFAHPLLRSAVYHGAASPARRAAHAALAAATEGESRAWHLAHATVGEDESVASALEQAGLRARRRGAPASAATALQRAAGLSPPGADRVRRTIEAARDFHVAGHAATALRLLDAIDDGGGALQRADAQHVRGRVFVLQGRIDAAYRLLESEGRRIGRADPDRAATMLAEACMDRFLNADRPRAVELARDACAIAAEATPGVRAFAEVMLAAALILGGERDQASRLLDRHLPLLRAADPLTEAGQLVSVAAQCYFWLERHDVAAELLGDLTAAARRASAPSALVLPLCCQAELDLRTGRWAVATAQLEEAANLGDEISHSVFAAYARECLARLAAAQGDEPRCREHAARALRLIEAHRNEFGRLYLLSALGLLELGLGRIETAILTLEQARTLADSHDMTEPNVVHWHADLVEAYIRAGRSEDALDALEALARRAHRTGGRWALGTSARCRGLLAPDAGADECFAESLDHLEALGAAFEIARTHLCRGERLRRSGRRTDARQSLRLAIDGFEELGAAPWSGRAQAELRATGATARRRSAPEERDRLTPHELQVARLVAGGATNKEAAASLFLSTKTIEFHLARIYRKLDVRTRTELAAVAARRGWLEHR